MTERDVLTDNQRQRVALMDAVVRECAESPLVLKGGTALLLAHGVDRYSEAIDFDAPVAINLEARIKRAAQHVGAQVEGIRVRKNTATTRRYLVDFTQGGQADTLNIEMSLRDKAIDEQAVVNRAGLRVYGVETLIEQKIDALEHRTRARDLYDLAFLMTHHAERFTPAQLERLTTQVNDPDQLHSRFLGDFIADTVIPQTTLDDVVLALHLRTEQVLAERPALPAHLTAAELLKANGVQIINDQPRDTFVDEKTQKLHAPPPNLPEVETYARALMTSYARWRANQEPGLSAFEKTLYTQALVSAVGSQTGLFRTNAASMSNASVAEATKTAITPLAQRTVAAMLTRLQRTISEDRYRDRDHDVSDTVGRERER